MSQIKSALTLEEVQKEFVSWRANKQKSEKIPNNLWDHVAQLMKHHRSGKLSKVLGITTNQLRAKGLLPATTKNTQREKEIPTFVEVTIPPRLVHETATLTFNRGELSLCIQHPSDEQVQLFINALTR
jgi:hypothetical protein